MKCLPSGAASAFVVAITASALAETPNSAATAPNGDSLTKARQLFDSAEGHYRREEWDGAIADFLQAYRISGMPELLYNVAQAERRAGDCAAALRFYERFKASQRESVPDLEQKMVQMKVCATTKQVNAVPPITVRTIKAGTPHPVAGRLSVRPAIEFGCVTGAVLSVALGVVFAVRAHEAEVRVTAANGPSRQWGPRDEAYQSSGQRSGYAAVGFFGSAAALTTIATWVQLSSSPGKPGRVSLSVTPQKLALTGSWAF